MDPVTELLNPNAAEYGDFYRPENWRNNNYRYRLEYPRRQKFCASRALLTAGAIVGGIYFLGVWVAPFFVALWRAR